MGRFATVCGLKANLLFVFFSDDFAIVSSFLLYLLVKFVETGCAMIQVYCYLVFYFPCFLLLSLVLIVCSYLKVCPFFSFCRRFRFRFCLLSESLQSAVSSSFRSESFLSTPLKYLAVFLNKKRKR